MISIVPFYCSAYIYIYIYIYNLFFFKGTFIYFLAALGLRCCTWALVAASGGYSSLRCAGFSLRWFLILEHSLQARGLQQLWHAGSVVVACGLQSAGSVIVAHGLSCSAHMGSSRTHVRDRTHVPCVVRLILNHCTTREVPSFLFFILFSLPQGPNEIFLYFL